MAMAKSTPKWIGYALHGLAVLVALVFLLTGGTKLAGQQMHVENFIRWGYPLWFMYVTGTIEVLGATLVVIPKTRFYGGALLTATMVGAVFTHLRAGEMAAFPVPLVLGVLAAFIAWMNWPGRS